jgi:hypothetical protein
MLAVNAFTGPQVQAHLPKIVTANARDQAHLCALARSGNRRVTALAAWQAIKRLRHAGLATFKRLRNVGNQVHIPAGHANDVNGHQVAPGVP